MPKGIFDRTEWRKIHSKRMSGSNHPKYKDGRTFIKNKCFLCQSDLKDYRSKTCIKCVNVGRIPSEKARMSMSRSHYQVGNKHWNWQGGKSKQVYPKNFNYRLKERVRKRDNFCCVICGISQKEIGRKLDVHHINYFKEDLSGNNLVSLCNKCHGMTGSSDKDYWERFFYYGKGSYNWDKQLKN